MMTFEKKNINFGTAVLLENRVTAKSPSFVSGSCFLFCTWVVHFLIDLIKSGYVC